MPLLSRRTVRATLATLLVLACAEQFVFYLKRRRTNQSKDLMPGPSMVPPLIGQIFTIISNPHRFWEDQRAFGELSWNSLVGKFMIFATDLPVVRKAFMENSHDSFILALHPNADYILGDENIAFMHGPSHKALRASFLSLFTRKALSSYITTQYELIQDHIKVWLKDTEQLGSNEEYLEMWPKVRDLNIETSLKVFLSDNISDHKLFKDLFLAMTQGFLSIPLYFPGTGLWYAVKAREQIVDLLEIAAGKSKAYIAAGNDPRCLMDYWSQHMLTVIKLHEGPGMPEHSTDREMAMVFLDFLFAAQDASTSSLDWTLCLMADYPEVLARVREEQDLFRPNHEPVSYEILEKMTYTKAVVSEILRFRPPAPMMPFKVKRDIDITSDYQIPKGSILIADIWKPTIEGFPNGTSFDPDRMMPDRREDAKYRDSYLTFGLGPHHCVGQNYAINHLTTFLAEMAFSCEWKRKITSKSGNFEYMPTVCPGDCLMRFDKRRD